MKHFIILFFTFFMVAVSMEAQGKMCLTLDRQIIKVENLVKRDQAILSKNGRYLVYPEKRGKEGSEKIPAIMLLDLETQEKREFLYDDGSVVQAGTATDTEVDTEAGTEDTAVKENRWKYLYRFSKDESALLGFIRGSNIIKVWSLPDLEEKIISVTEGRGALQVGFLDDGRLMIVEMEKEKAELVLSVTNEIHSVVYEGKKEPATAHIFDYYNEAYSLEYFFRVVDLPTLNQSERAFQNYLSGTGCAIMDLFLHRFLRVHEDGSLTATSLTEKKEPEEIFGPVKGFTLNSNPVGIAKQCIFLSEHLNILKAPGKEGYIFRDLKEGRESFFESEFLIFQDDEGQYRKFAPPFLHMMKPLIKYPFALSPDSHRAYHIPSGQYSIIRAKSLELSKDGQVSLELQIKNDKPVLQVISHPLNPYQRKVIFEIDVRKVCNTDIGEDGLITVMSFEGDLFSIDVESAVVRKRLGFPGQCFLQKDVIAGSGTVFLGVNREGEHVVNKLHEQCVENSESDGPDTIKEKLIHLSQEKDPAQSSHLAVLLDLLAKNHDLQSYGETLGSVFWNILLRSPTLYLELHRQYPDAAKMLPVNSTYPDFGSDSLARLTSSVQFILKLTTSTINYTPFSDWDFLRMLKPVLRELPKKDRELYMERITVSISNGAAKEIPLLQDVFQSKIYYVVKGHVQELFGMDRQPVSDVSVIRREDGGMATLILSSDPIEVHSNISTGSDSTKRCSDVSTGDSIEGCSDVSTGDSTEADSHVSTVGSIEGSPDVSTEESIEKPSDISTDFGLHYALIEEVGHKELEGKAGSTLNRLIEWGLSGGKSYRANVNVRVRNNYSLSRFKEPNYTDILRDYKMVGVVVIGSSLRDFTGELTKEYLSYFRDEGFQFSSAEDTDLKTFLLDRISSCEVDYFLKESHSDGDERNVFRFSRGNHVIRGLKYKEGGLIEVVYLIFPRTLNPEEDSLGTDVLSNRELGQAISEREAKGCGQITYFNTSCWSHVKARYEIEAVNSFSFLNIPSMNLSDTFANTEDNALRILLDSYRNGLTFEGFRKALNSNKGYRTGNRNHYIFPDDALYGQKVLSHIIVPLDIQIQLERREGEAWTIINPDEAL